MKGDTMNIPISMVSIYINSVCTGNPGNGGYGCIVAFPMGKTIKKSNFKMNTTINEMELMAVIDVINTLPQSAQNSNIKIYVNRYLYNGITYWIQKWKKNNWICQTGIVNHTILWKKLDEKKVQFQIQWLWIDSKKSAESYKNECEELAKTAINQKKGTV